MTVTDLGVMLSLVGATGSAIVSYVVPGFLYFYTFKDHLDKDMAPWKVYASLLQGCVGLVIIPVCLTFIFL